MKKRVISIITFVLLNLIAINNVFAVATTNAKLNVSTSELKKGQEVEVTLKLDNFSEIKKGINAYKATLQYDDNIFEQVVQSSFECLNNWEELKYNALNKEIVAYRKVGIKESQDVVKIKLKVKDNVEASKSDIKLVNITASEGKGDILVQDAKVTVNIIKDQAEIPSEPENPSNPDDDSNDNNNDGNTNKPEKPSNPDDGSNDNNNENITKPEKPLNPDNDSNSNSQGNNNNSGIDSNGNNNGGSTNNTEIETPSNPNINNSNGNNNQTNNSQNNQGNNSNTETEDSTNKLPENQEQSEKIKKPLKMYFGLIIFILLQGIVVVTIVLNKRKKTKNNQQNENRKKYMTFLVAGILCMEFIGTSVVFALTFAQRGELNGDAKIDYADVSLLELHLIDLEKLPSEKLENADMNSDGKITVNDLSLLIQKLENTLEYEVDITDLNTNNYYPNKNDEITISFNAQVSYDANIEKLLIDGKEYEVKKTPNNDLEYTFNLNVGEISGVKTYKITEAHLDNNKKIKLDNQISVDVLKEKPTISNYTVEEDIDNTKLIINFDVEDKDYSMTTSTIKISDADTIVASQNLQIGKNRIEIEVEENKVYQVLIVLNYDLDTNTLENEENHLNHELYEKELQLIVDYNFNISNIKTLKDGKETTTFSKNDQIEISFESTNSTKYIPLHVKINGIDHILEQNGNTYKAKIDSVTELGEKIISIDEVILSNGKKFELKENNTQTINVIKRSPNIENFTTIENETSVRVVFELMDEDEAVSEINIVLLNAQGQEINHLKLSAQEIKDNQNIISKFISTNNEITSKYQIKVKMNYNLTGNDSDTVIDSLVKEEEIEALPKVEIKNVNFNKYYLEKGGQLKITYSLKTNKEEIKRIVVNNTNCIAKKLENGDYEVTLEVGKVSGIHQIETTKIYFSETLTASINHKANIDILKDKPTIENFNQIDNVLEKKVTFNFNVKDDENAFISGKAILTSNGVSQEKEIVKGQNTLTFTIEPDVKYTLEIKSTYDLDSNSAGMPEEDNKVIDEIIETRNIEVISDYQPSISNIKTYNGTTETVYFERGQQATLSFDFTSQSSYYPIKVVVNGIEYALEKQGNNYKANITVFSEPGPKEVVIQKVILNNTKELELTENNVTKVGILKLRPTITEFGYEEKEDNTVEVSFKVNDPEKTITGGTIIITDETGKKVKEEAFAGDKTGVSFTKNTQEEYEIKVLANYDLDSNKITTGDNEYLNQLLLSESINISAKRLFEIKDITGIVLYKKSTEDKIVEADSLTQEEVENFKSSDYIVKVQTKQMPSFYVNIKEAEITQENEVKLLLDYDNAIQYENNTKHNGVKVTYGKLENGVAKNEISENSSKSENTDIYIPEYDRVKNISGFNSSKEIAYHNINKLMPYYEAKYLVIDGKKIESDSILNTKIINHVLPYSNGQLLTYLTTQNYDKITSIKIVFNDYSVQEYNVEYDKEKTKIESNKPSIAIYNIPELDLAYAYDNYIVKENQAIVEEISNYIKGLDYSAKLDPLTTAGDGRIYKDYFNETTKAESENIALQILQNNSSGALSIDNEILSKMLKQELIDNEALNKIIYGYNYYYKWYNFDIRGTKVSDLMLFHGKSFNKTMTLENVINEVFVGNIGYSATDAFFKNQLQKYTGSSTIIYFLEGIMTKFGGYTDVNDWFTEYMGERQALLELKIDKYPELEYRAWRQLKRWPSYILPLITVPKYSGYIFSAPTMFAVGSQRAYVMNNTESGRNQLKATLNNHGNLVKNHLTTLAGTFDRGKWNNYCMKINDTNRILTKSTNIPGLGPITEYQYAKKGSTTDLFLKNFNEVVNLWVPYNSNTVAGVGGGNGIVQFIGQHALNNYSTYTHEYQHALIDKMIMFSKGLRFGLEEYANGHMEQWRQWSEDANIAPLYFNTSFYLNKEGLSTQNLTPERIDTREKLENYYKGQQNAIDILDYVEAQAFIKLTPEEQAKIATRMTQTGSNTKWGTIDVAQAEAMNLTTLESLWDNKIILRPNNAWGYMLKTGTQLITSKGPDDYGFESAMVTRWYIGHNDSGKTDSMSTKRNFFEMLGYGGVDAYVIYGSRQSSNDLNAIQKITKAKTGTAMNWKEYKMSRYAEIEEAFKITNTDGNITSNADNQYIDIDYMIEKYTEALINDANNNDRNISQRTNLRKIFYHYLKRVTNDFVADPYGTDLEVTHIKTAQELVEKMNAQPYGYYVLDNDIDFSGMTTNVTQTFMGKLDGNGHKITGNTIPIFTKIRFGYVKNLILENTNIPENITNQGALAATTQYSIIEDVSAKNLKIFFGARNDISLIGGNVSTVTYKNCTAERLKFTISSVSDINKLQENPGAIFTIENDIDFTGYTGSVAVVTGTFTGQIDGKGHTLSNLKNLSLFEKFNGKIENINIKNFSNETEDNFATAFANQTSGATLKNMRFEGIKLVGANNVAVISGQDGERDGSTNSLFENISVKDANVKATGVYVSTFIGRKFNGSIKNVFVQGNMEVTTTENGGIVGASQKGGTIENVVSKVNITKPENTYTSNINASEFNGGVVGNIYDKPSIKNSIALGSMEGFTDSKGDKKLPYKFAGAVEATVKASITNCYEYTEAQGFSRVNEETKDNLKEATKEQIQTKEFYKDTLYFDETIWNLDVIAEKGHPELR